jgi:hypothetical protein
MLTIYPERREQSRSSAVREFHWCSLADHRFLLGGFIALGLVLLPSRADLNRHFSNSNFAKIPVYEKSLRDSAVRGNDAFSSVLIHLRTYWPVIRNPRYLTIIDYSKPSYVKRMYLIDMKTGKVEKHLVSHGRNSGWAYATSFSNEPESFESCCGFFVTGKKYSGKHGIALELYGLQKGVNDNAFRRGIVIHGSNYVSMRSIMLNRGRLGRSLGCPAIPVAAAQSVIDRIKGGSLVYIHAGSN